MKGKRKPLSRRQLLRALRKPTARPAMSGDPNSYVISNVTVVGIAEKLDIIGIALCRLLKNEYAIGHEDGHVEGYHAGRRDGLQEGLTRPGNGDMGG
jgi:hypothetical protein